MNVTIKILRDRKRKMKNNIKKQISITKSLHTTGRNPEIKKNQDRGK